MNKLYTLGYTGRKPDDIAVIAKGLGAAVVDIRLNPVSRMDHWNGYSLRSFLDRQGLTYAHIPDLGNLNYKNGGPIAIKDITMGALSLRTLLFACPCVLLCACADHESCHRSFVAQHMAAYMGAKITHLGVEAAPRESLDQMSLF